MIKAFSQQGTEHYRQNSEAAKSTGFLNTCTLVKGFIRQTMKSRPER